MKLLEQAISGEEQIIICLLNLLSSTANLNLKILWNTSNLSMEKLAKTKLFANVKTIYNTQKQPFCTSK